MAVDAILYIFGTLISWVAAILPDFSIYPDKFLAGIEYCGEKIHTLDFFIFDIPNLMIIFIWFLSFESYYFTAQKIGSLINFFRGSGKLEI
jgi:hypothetical protein